MFRWCINSEIIFSVGWLDTFWPWEQRMLVQKRQFSSVFLTCSKNYKITYILWGRIPSVKYLDQIQNEPSLGGDRMEHGGPSHVLSDILLVIFFWLQVKFYIVFVLPWWIDYYEKWKECTLEVRNKESRTIFPLRFWAIHSDIIYLISPRK